MKPFVYTAGSIINIYKSRISFDNSQIQSIFRRWQINNFNIETDLLNDFRWKYWDEKLPISSTDLNTKIKYSWISVTLDFWFSSNWYCYIHNRIHRYSNLIALTMSELWCDICCGGGARWKPCETLISRVKQLQHGNKWNLFAIRF